MYIRKSPFNVLVITGRGDAARVILAEQEKLSKTLGAQSKPAVAGFFRKLPNLDKLGVTENDKVQSENLYGAYKDVKLYSHKNGYHFAGTFLRPTSSPREEERNVDAVMTRLKSQTKNAIRDVSSLMSRSILHETILLGIHISKVQIPHLKHGGKVELPELDSHKHKAKCVYLVSIAAKLPGSGRHHTIRSFLQEDFPPKQSFAGEFAMERVERVIQDLVRGASVKDFTLIVFRT